MCPQALLFCVHQRLRELITQAGSLAEQLRYARALLLASGAPLLSWDEREREIVERRGGAA